VTEFVKKYKEIFLSLDLEEADKFGHYSRALVEIGSFFKSRFIDEGQMKAYQDAVIEYFDSCIEEVNELRLPGVMENMTIERMLEIRALTIGAHSFNFVLEVISGEPMNMVKYYKEPNFVGICRAADMMVLLINEVYSYNKEVVNEEITNTITIVMKQKKCDAQTGCEYVKALIEKTVNEVNELCESFHKQHPDDPDVLRWIEAQKYWISSNYEYHRYCFRYRKFRKELLADN